MTGALVVSVSSPRSVPLLEDAERLAALWYPGRLWFGPSGGRVSPGRVVAAVEATAARIAAGEGPVDGWRFAASLGDADVRRVAARILELILCAHTGAPAAVVEVWVAVPGRGRAEVRELLGLAVQFARRAEVAP